MSRTTEIKIFYKKRGENQVIWKRPASSRLHWAAALVLCVAAALASGAATSSNARRQQQIRAHQLEASGGGDSKFELISGDQDGGGGPQQRKINWLPTSAAPPAHLNGHQPQVNGRQQQASPAVNSSKQPATSKQEKATKRGRQKAGAAEQPVEVFKMKQFESILALAANAAKVGALASDTDQAQQSHKGRQKPANATTAASNTVVEFEPNELAKSMQMMSASIATNDAPPPPTMPVGKTSPQRQAEKRKASARQMAANASESSEDFATGFDEAGLMSHDNLPPALPANPFELPADLQPPTPQLPDVEHEHLNEPQHYLNNANKPREGFLHNDFHVVNSLPSLLDSHADHHDKHHRHHEEAASASYPPSDFSGPIVQGHKRGEASSIRVVFNNNPQFIIGSNTRELADGHGGGGLIGAASSPLARKTRQPSPTLYDDQHQDESAPDETKVISSKTGALPPCADKTHQHQEPVLPVEVPRTVNIEKVNLNDEPPPPPPVSKTQPPPPPPQLPPPQPTPPPTQQQVQVQEPVQVQEQVPLPQPKPVVKSKAPPPVIEQQQQQQELDDPVLTPFNQMVKSGVRPPLRMVISMRNKHGDVMKVPINLHGTSQTKVQQQEMDFPQMQIQFEKPSEQQMIIEPQQQIVQIKSTGRDENTPVGGDIFDPALIKPFERPASKTPPASKSPQFVPQQQQLEEQAPELPELPRPQMRPRSKEPEPQVKAAPEIVPQVPVPVQQTKEALPPPPPSVPPVQTKVTVPEVPPVVQQKTVEPPVVQQKTVEPPIVQQKADCNNDKVGQVPLAPPPPEVQAPVKQPEVQQPDFQQQQQQQQLEQTPLVLPMTSDPSAGIVHMLMPRLTQFQNRTFANMFTQFQQALSEHMTSHLAGEQRKQQAEVDALEAARERKAQQKEDEQEDLMVALMAANMNGQQQQAASRGRTINGLVSQQLGPLSMTVIKPPKGTSLQDAIASHARDGQTMAILSALGARRLAESSNRLDGDQSGQGGLNPLQQPSGAVPVGVDVRLRQPPNERARPSGSNSNSNPSPTDGSGEIDPDGFSSASGLNQSPSVAFESIDLASERDFWANKLLGRFKRSLEAGDHLEPGDKLTNQTKRATVKKPAVKAKLKVANQTLTKRMGVAPFVRPSLRAKSQIKRHEEPGDFQTAASQTSESSSEPDGEDPDAEGGADGPDEMDADEEPPNSSSSSSSAGDQDEPAASASNENSGNSNSSGGDEGDYAGDMGDDFDSAPASGGFDNDDEPYNQAAASDRDYSGASSSFEIPSIDINPNTLQQKGCRTVLREVQEIPLNGLGAIQANGRPGSGYSNAGGVESAASNNVGAVRVRRQAPSDNLINSRKVTSIVMTKECHFPNDAGVQKPAGKHVQPAISKQRPLSGRQVEPVAFGNQGGASQARAAVVQRPQVVSSVKNTPQQPRPQQQQQQQVLVVPQNYPTYQVLKTPDAQPALISSFYQPARAQEVRASLPAQQQQAKQTSFFTAAASQPQVARQQQQQQQPASQQLQPSASSIRRRSVAYEPPQQQQLAVSNFNKQQPKEVYQPQASGVVARKSYKPPSENDPYHTLSYSSQTGADPDMEQDEDDSVVMGNEEQPQQESAESGRHGQRRRQPQVFSSRGTLSERERAALMDPNRDDTDPESEDEEAPQVVKQSRQQQPANRQTGRIATAASSTTKNGGGGSGKQPARKPQPEVDETQSGPEDADENDGDLTDESRPETQLRALPRNKLAPPAMKAAASATRPKPLAAMQQTPRQMARLQPPIQLNNKQREFGANNRMAQKQAAAAQRSSGNIKTSASKRSAGEEPARFGKSFKFEHELSRVGPAASSGVNARGVDAVADHLRSLKPGLQGYVTTRGQVKAPEVRGGAAQNARPLASANQLRAAVASTIGRRSDDDDDDDDDLDDDSDGGRQQGRASSGQRRLAPTPEADGDADDGDNPDADPELNPRESQLPAHSKPKRFEKSFAYVHRDLPKKGARNPDDFVVSYGRGNLQTEHEDYDSDREPAAAHANPSGGRGGGGGGNDQERRAAASQMNGPIVARRPRNAAELARAGPQMRRTEFLARRPISLAQAAGHGRRNWQQ